MVKELSIRDALLEEAGLVLDIWREAFASDDLHGELDDVARVILDDHDSRLFIASIDGRAAGTLIVTFDGWRGHFYRLAVLPRFQRRGLASALVKEGERWLAAVGCNRARATVVEESAWATSFWQAQGYSADSASYVRRLTANRM